MEEQRIGTKIRIGIGLLIFSALLANAASAQSSSEIRSLRVTPQNGVVYSGSDCMFVLVVPAAKPSDVQVETPVLPSGISFVSMRRTDYIEKGAQAGTEIDLWFRFRDAREYSLPPLKIKIRNRSYSIPFNSVAVVQDPATLVPCLILRFENGTEVNNTQQSAGPLFTVAAGDKIGFTVFVQYAVQVMNLEWTVPKDALFTEIQKYEITEGKPRGREFSAELVPVGRFEWQPLAAGITALPGMHLTATTYSGGRVTLSQPDMRVSVLHAEKKTAAPADSDESYFTYAFTEAEKTETEKVRTAASEADCERLASLRIQERHSFFQRKAAAERRAFEKDLGVTEGGSEPSEPLFLLLLSCTAAIALFAVILFVLKKRRNAVISTAVACVFLAGTTVSGMHLSAMYGVFKGGSIHSVPDESSDYVSPADSGQRVRIEEVAGKWMYIQYGSTGGWILSSSVIVIR